MSKDSTITEYYTARLSEKNIRDLEKLYTVVYGKQPVPDYFFAKYDTTFTNIKYTGFIAYNNAHVPIAFYGVIPCLMLFSDGVVLSAQSADTMTHPDYRNQGLFVMLARQTFDLCHSVGIKLLFGFPNQNSLHGFVNKLGWQSPGRMDCFVIQTGAPILRRAFRKLSFLKSRYKKYQQKLLSKYLQTQYGIENSGLADNYAGVYRDYHYRKYKTYAQAQVLKIDKALLWVKLNHELLIGDLLVEAADFDITLSQLKNIACKLGIKEIHFHSSSGTTNHQLFAQRFSAIPSFPVIFKDLDGKTVTGKIKFTSADIDTF